MNNVIFNFKVINEEYSAQNHPMNFVKENQTLLELIKAGIFPFGNEITSDQGNSYKIDSILADCDSKRQLFTFLLLKT